MCLVMMEQLSVEIAYITVRTLRCSCTGNETPNTIATCTLPAWLKVAIVPNQAAIRFHCALKKQRRVRRRSCDCQKDMHRCVQHACKRPAALQSGKRATDSFILLPHA